MRNVKTSLAIAAALISLVVTAHAAPGADPKPADLASVYGTIADSILAAKASETAIVRAILASERDAAMAALDRAASASGTPSDLAAAAARIGDLATEGGAAIEPIRTRLLQGGHHHHADDTGPDATYDEGYVVLTKKLKQEALELGKRCAKAAEATAVDAKEVAALREALASLATRALAAQ